MVSIKQLAVTAVAGAVITMASPASAEKIFRFESVTPGSTLGQFSIGWVQVVEKGTDYKVQMSTGKPVTKTVLMGAKGDIDFFAYTPGIMHVMSKGIAMYKKVKGAPELSKNVRAVVNFPLGVYHYVVYESSGIKSFADLKNKKVFLGPPGGIAPRMSSALIEAISGLKAKQDYTLMRFDWTAGRTAFSDRQMDVTGFPTGAPSPIIQEYAASEPIRFLGIPEDKLEDPGVKAVLNSPGRTLDKLDPAAYGDGVVNKEPVYTIANWIGLATNKDVSEEAIYNMLKAYWDNLGDVHATAAWMTTTLTKENALKEMNIPLHAGAYRYYTENGWTVPEGLKPPEAK